MTTFIAVVVFLFSSFSLAMTAIDYRNAKPKERKKQKVVFIFIACESALSFLLSCLVIVNAL